MTRPGHRLALAGALSVAVALGAAGSTAPVTGATLATHATKTPKKTKKPAKTTTHKQTAATIGSTIVVENETKQYEAVTLVALADPASAQTPTFTTPPAGDRFVGVTLQIHNESKGTDSNSADDNTSVVGSNKQVYSSTFGTLAGCTDFDDGQYTLESGATEVGCVTFAVPTGVSIAKVEYNPNAGFSTNNAIWTVKG